MELPDRFINDYDGNKLVQEAFKKKYTDFFITVMGTVVDVLPEDLEPPTHQRFLIKIPGTSQTILIAHNLQYGPRLHLKEGDTLLVSGEYVWNQHGGLMHLTHRNPNGNFQEGWVEIVKEVHNNPKPTHTVNLKANINTRV